jgi:hypothetical protein
MPANPVVFDDASGTAVEDAVSLDPGRSLSIGYGETCADGARSAVLEVQTDPSRPASEGVEGCSRIAPLRGGPPQPSAAVVVFTADLAVTIHGAAEDLKGAKVAADALRQVGQARPTGVAFPARPRPSVRSSIGPAGRNRATRERPRKGSGRRGRRDEGARLHPPAFGRRPAALVRPRRTTRRVDRRYAAQVAAGVPRPPRSHLTEPPRQSHPRGGHGHGTAASRPRRLARA